MSHSLDEPKGSAAVVQQPGMCSASLERRDYARLNLCAADTRSVQEAASRCSHALVKAIYELPAAPPETRANVSTDIITLHALYFAGYVCACFDPILLLLGRGIWLLAARNINGPLVSHVARLE